MTSKKDIPIEKIVKTAEDSLLKKLSDHKEVVEIITEVWKDADDAITKQHESIKKSSLKLI